MDKKIEINNQGQIAANIDSPKGRVRINQQQMLRPTPQQENALRQHLNDSEVQEVLALPLPADEKAKKVGGLLAKVAGVGRDAAVDFAAKLIADMVTPR